MPEPLLNFQQARALCWTKARCGGIPVAVTVASASTSASAASSSPVEALGLLLAAEPPEPLLAPEFPDVFVEERPTESPHGFAGERERAREKEKAKAKEKACERATGRGALAGTEKSASTPTP